MVCHLPPLHIGQQQARPFVPSSWESLVVLPPTASKHTISNILQQEQKCFSPADTESLSEEQCSGIRADQEVTGRRRPGVCTQCEWRDKESINQQILSSLALHKTPPGSPPPAGAVLAKDVLGTSRGWDKRYCGGVGHIKCCTVGQALSGHLHWVGCGACENQRLKTGGRVSGHVAPSSGQGPSVADPQLPALVAGHDLSFGGPTLCPPWAALVWLAWLLGFWP